TMRHSLARRISLHRPTLDEMAILTKRVAELEAKDPRTEAEEKKLGELRIVQGQLDRRMKRIAFIDPVDLRFNRFEPTPKPNARAAMFSLMGVFGSMRE